MDLVHPSAPGDLRVDRRPSLQALSENSTPAIAEQVGNLHPIDMAVATFFYETPVTL